MAKRSSPDVRHYREQGDVFFEFVPPPPAANPTWKFEVEDQGLSASLTKTPLGFLEVRVNPAGGEDATFTVAMPTLRPPLDSLKVRFVWKRGESMALWLNDRQVSAKPFRPPALS